LVNEGQFYEWINSYLYILRLVFNPKRLIIVIRKTKVIELSSKAITHILLSSMIVLTIAMFTKKNSGYDKTIHLAISITLLSIQFAPSIIAGFFFIGKNTHDIIKLSFFIPIFIVPIIQMPFLCSILFFIAKEQYILYYFSIISLLLGNLLIVIGVPAITNTGISRLLSVLCSIIIFITINAGAFYFKNSESDNNMIYLDPIYSEYVNQNVFEDSRVFVVHKYASELISKWIAFQIDYDAVYLDDIKNIVRSLESKRELFKTNYDELTFSRNKSYYELSFRLIEISTQFMAEIENAKIISEMENVNPESIINEINRLESLLQERDDSIAKLRNEIQTVMDRLSSAIESPDMLNQEEVDNLSFQTEKLIEQSDVLIDEKKEIEDQIKDLESRIKNMRKLSDRVEFGLNSINEINHLATEITASYEELNRLMLEQTKITEWKVRFGI